MSIILVQARIYAKDVEPIETLKTLAKTNALYEMARIIDVAPRTMRTFLEKHGIVPIDHDPKLTAEKISKSRQTKLVAEREAVSFFTCDKINYGCGQSKPIVLRDVHNPKICALCAKNRRRNLV